MVEKKTHYKMYKAKKRWMVTGVTMFSAVLGATAIASADTVIPNVVSISQSSTTSNVSSNQASNLNSEKSVTTDSAIVKPEKASSTVASFSSSDSSKQNETQMGTNYTNTETSSLNESKSNDNQNKYSEKNSSKETNMSTIADYKRNDSSSIVSSKQQSSSVSNVSQKQNSNLVDSQSQTKNTVKENSNTATITIKNNSKEKTDSSSELTDGDVKTVSKAKPSVTGKEQKNDSSVIPFDSKNTNHSLIQVQQLVPTSFATSGTPYINISENQGYVKPDTVDISSYQPNMSVSDFQKLKKYGIKNVIVKTSQFSNYENPYAAQQIANAEKAGLNVAVYHYAGFANPAQATEEADYLVGVLQKLNIPKDMAVICDLESNYTKNNQVGSSLSAFWRELGNKGYKNQVLYVYASYANQYPQVLNTISHDKIWMAQYPYSPTNYWNTQYGAWQYSDNGHCPGISYTLDLSHCYNSNIFARGGQLSNGQQFVNGHWQYYENGQTVKNRYIWINDQNKEVYYDGNGNMVYGQQKINGKWQYFDPQTGAQAKNKYVWLADDKKEVYYDSLGNMVYGQQKIDGKWQYFDPQTGAQAKNKYIYQNGNEYYYDSNGNMVYGQQKINGYWQYFDPQTGVQAKNKYVWLADDKKEVYYDGNGNMVYNQQKINGKWQYFDPQTGAQAKNKYVWLADQNKEVFYDGYGNMVYGWQKNLLNNHATQYFDEVTGAQYKNGRYTIDGKQYIFDEYGNLVNNIQSFAVQSQDKQIASHDVIPTSHQNYDLLSEQGFETDKATYKPGDTVHASLTFKNTTQIDQWGTWKLNVYNPTSSEQTVASGSWKTPKNQSDTVNVDWKTPNEDNKGYVLDLQLFTSSGKLLTEYTNAVDVNTDPYKHPRYGALTDFSVNNIDQEKAMVDSLAKAYHLNMQMLYDCYFEPQNPLPNQDNWKNWHGDTISRDAIKAIIDQIHQDGSKAFFYDMIGATSDKSMLQTGFYNPETGEWLNANLGNGNYQYYHDIANAEWQNYIIPIIVNQAKQMGFDGWQGDTPGALTGNSYNQIKDKSKAFSDSDYYHYFASAVMDYLKKNDPNFAFGLNSVNTAGQSSIAKDSNDTFDYSELWSEAYPTYGDIAKVIEQNWQNDKKPLIVPAYIYNQWRDEQTNGKVNNLPKTYNDNAVRQLVATIMANGGSPMILADGGYLIDDQYYPWMRMENGKQINMSNALGNPQTGYMRHYFDFDTAYENILQNPDLALTNNYLQVWDGNGVGQGKWINRNDVESNTVYAFAKSNGKNMDTINLVNLMGSTNQWQINNPQDNDSHNIQQQKNLWIKYYPSEQNKNIQHIYLSSPDNAYQSKRTELPFKEYTDPSGHKYVEFKVPSLDVWDLVYMTTDDNLQDPQRDNELQVTYQDANGNKVGDYSENSSKSLGDTNSIAQQHVPSGYHFVKIVSSKNSSNVANDVQHNTTTVVVEVAKDESSAGTSTPDNKPSQGGSSGSSTDTNKPSQGGSSSSSTDTDKPSQGGSSSSSTDAKPSQGGSSSSSTNTKPNQGGSSSSSTDDKPSQGGSSNSSTNADKPSSVNPSDKPTDNSSSSKPSQNKPNDNGSSSASDGTHSMSKPNAGNTDADHNSEKVDDHSSQDENSSQGGKIDHETEETGNETTSGIGSSMKDEENKQHEHQEPGTPVDITPNTTVDSGKSHDELTGDGKPTDVKATNNVTSQSEAKAGVQENTQASVKAEKSGTAKAIEQDKRSSSSGSSNRLSSDIATSVGLSNAVQSSKGTTDAKAESSQQSLPQTGEQEDQNAAEIGLAMLGVVGTIGISIRRKRYGI